MKHTFDLLVSPEIGFDADLVRKYLKEKHSLPENAFVR